MPSNLKKNKWKERWINSEKDDLNSAGSRRASSSGKRRNSAAREGGVIKRKDEGSRNQFENGKSVSIVRCDRRGKMQAKNEMKVQPLIVTKRIRIRRRDTKAFTRGKSLFAL